MPSAIRKRALWALLCLQCLAPRAVAHAQTAVYYNQWGVRGSVPGAFETPCSIAVGPDGSVYVADTWNHRIQKFTANGDLLAVWGDNSTIAYAMGVAVDAAGSVYVADYGNSLIRKYASDGTLMTFWGGPGTGNGQFTNAGGVAVDGAGRVFAVDLGHRIERFTNNGAFTLVWGAPGSGPGQLQFAWPCGAVAADDSGNVYVADTGNNRVQKFSIDGAYLGRWGQFGIGPGDFSSPRGIAVDHTGRVYVADEGNHRIQVFSSNGTYLTQWGGQGGGDGELRGPRGVAIGPGGLVYVADTGNHRVQVFTGLAPFPPTQTALTTDSNPSAFGEQVTLTATVAPTEATGAVTFRDGNTVLGQSPVTDGIARLSLNTLLHGRHVLHATFISNGNWSASVADSLIQEVEIGHTSITVASSANPSPEFRPVNFFATVQPIAPATSLPAGRIRYLVDGQPFGSDTLMVNGSAPSVSVDSLAVGIHSVVAIYLPADTLRYAPDTSTAHVHTVTSSGPEITSVRDVPNDQGGRVFVTWHCLLDQPGVQIITGYRVWRRVPEALLASLHSGDVLAMRNRAISGDVGETYWEAVATLPSAQLVAYGYTAQTTQDSLAGSNPYTAFFVQALTAEPFRFYNSPPDSGYSVDNLAPPTPSPFVARYGSQGTALHWLPSRAIDVFGYRLYRGLAPGFVPSASTLLSASPDTGYFDAQGGAEHFYKLSAVDIHGNEGRWAMVSPAAPTAALATLVSSEVAENSIRLRWYLSLAEEATIILYRRGASEDWRAVCALTPDGSGYLTFADSEVTPGSTYAYRLGIRPTGGAESFAGDALVDFPSGTNDSRMVVRSPISSGSISVEFSSPVGRAVRVDLFDLSGRTIATRSVAGGAGRQSVTLAQAQDLAPGIYLVRVGLQRPVTTRVVVFR